VSKITEVYLSNFGSYKELHFKFSKEGLVLIQGPTGAGKSTLCDAVPWVLFGKTAKGGAVDEVKSWNSYSPTFGRVYFDDGSQVCRQRVPNDLYYNESKRGKDLNDTQKQINELLGFDYDTYITGAYYHEFSQTAQFFTTSAKNRRAITEQIIDYSTANKVLDKATAKLKTLKKFNSALTQEIVQLDASVGFLKNSIESAKTKVQEWENQRQERHYALSMKASQFNKIKSQTVKALEQKSQEFEQDRQNKIDQAGVEMEKFLAKLLPPSYYKETKLALAAKLDAIANCPTCGSKVHTEETEAIQKELYDLDVQNQGQHFIKQSIERLKKERQVANKVTNPYLAQIEAESARENTFRQQAKDLMREENPYSVNIAEAEASLEKVLETYKTKNSQLDEVVCDIVSHEQLIEVLAKFRSLLAESTVNQIQDHTNQLLADYFDGELKVQFTIEDADKLEVAITKDGNQAAFTQLSKGQRQLLKLCFSLSIMKAVANFHGVSFPSLFLDEALDGLDDRFKVKAFYLLQQLSLEYDTIFMVEHSQELKSRFENSYTVSLDNGWSKLEKC